MILLPYFWTLVPMLGTERLAEYYFIGKDPLFYSISGFRLEVDIICALVGSFAAGATLKSFKLATVSQSASVATLLVGVFVACDPRVCYSGGPDGLESVRIGLFLGSVAVAGAALGASARSSPGERRWEAALSESARFFAIAWYPVIFTFAGAKLLPPLDPWATTAILFVAAAATSASAAPNIGVRKGAAIPMATILLMVIVSAGIALPYLGTLASNVLQMALAVGLGGAAGATAAGVENMRQSLRRAVPVLFAASVILVLTMTVVAIPDAVSGVLPGPATTTAGGLAMGSPVYAAAYMDAPQGHAEGVGTTISFSGTNTTSIQADNFLAGGLGVHSAGCCVDGIDYAYRFDLYLFHGGNESLAASGWEVCDDNIACGGHSWKVLLLSQERQIGQGDFEGNVTLRMVWSGNNLVWLYSEGVGRFLNLTSFKTPGQENTDFNTGVSGGVSLSPQKEAYFFQFGVMSRYPLGHGGWRVSFVCPSTFSDGTWTCIPHASTLLGSDSYWKVIWRWGENYPGVSIRSDEAWQATFAFSSTRAAVDLQKLW